MADQTEITTPTHAVLAASPGTPPLTARKIAAAILRAGFGPVREVEAERDDLADRLSALLCDLTGGLMSKTGYSASTMIQAVEAEFEKHQTAEMVDAIARAESAEAAHAELVAGIEGLATKVKTEADEQWTAHSEAADMRDTDTANRHGDVAEILDEVHSDIRHLLAALGATR